jgi:hypothetical protein
MKDSTNKYLVLNSEGEHEYTIHVKTINKGEKFTLYRSNNNVWSSDARGEKIFSMTNTGDGVIFNQKIKTLDYAQLVELRILLGFENALDSEINHDNFKIIPVKNTINLKR